MSQETKLPMRSECWTYSIVLLLVGWLIYMSFGAMSVAGHYSAELPLLKGSVLVPTPQLSVRTELEQLQRQNGLTIGIVNFQGLGVLLFKKRAYAFHDLGFTGNFTKGLISRDGREIVISGSIQKLNSFIVVHPDGSDLREFGGFGRVGPMCWSYDKSMLVMANQVSFNIVILELKTRHFKEISSHGRVTSQCWSPDSKQIVYASPEGDISVLDLEKGSSISLGKGTDPTWSPDGKWIAYQDGDNYYVMPPTGEGKKKLFHKTRATSGVYWSPDSRFVAYVHQDFFGLDTEFYHLMVRRLDDGSEDWVANGGNVDCCGGFEWVTSIDLLEQVQSQAAR